MEELFNLFRQLPEWEQALISFILIVLVVSLLIFIGKLLLETGDLPKNEDQKPVTKESRYDKFMKKNWPPEELAAYEKGREIEDTFGCDRKY